jgi:hypothetical protein
MRNLREETNVSDGPPVEHSIMKRAWPYALALAVVVTGCYLALAPLLRSLNPGPTATASAALTGSNTTTVSQSKAIPLEVIQKGAGFTAYVGSSTKKKAKKASHKTVVPPVTTTHVFVTPPTSSTSGTSSSSSSSSSSTSTNAPKTPTAKTSTSKTAAANTRKSQVVGGAINQNDNGGFAGQGNGDQTMAGGKTSTLAGN